MLKELIIKLTQTKNESTSLSLKANKLEKDVEEELLSTHPSYKILKELSDILTKNIPKTEVKYDCGSDYYSRQTYKQQGYAEAQIIVNALLKKHREEIIEKELKS